MQFELEIGGRTRTIRVATAGDQLDVQVDDRAFAVDARRLGHDGMTLLVREGDGAVRSIDATVVPRAGGAFAVSVGGQTLDAALVSRFGRRGGEGGAPGSGPQQVLAPMPGKVIKVLVAPGDAVEPRQGLVVIEAMKMENELRATRGGRVAAVKVAEGQSVDAGTLLVTVE